MQRADPRFPLRGKMNERAHDKHERCGGIGASECEMQAVFAYWRTISADCLAAPQVQLVQECASLISSTSEEWRRAVDGDAAAAVNLALRMGKPSAVTLRVDLVMTLLLRAACEDSAAALVMAHRLTSMPLDLRIRARLAASWLIHCVWLGSRRRDRSIAVQLPDGKPPKSKSEEERP